MLPLLETYRLQHKELGSLEGVHDMSVLFGNNNLTLAEEEQLPTKKVGLGVRLSA